MYSTLIAEVTFDFYRLPLKQHYMTPILAFFTVFLKRTLVNGKEI